jgi:hypothetical protein
MTKMYEKSHSMHSDKLVDAPDDERDQEKSDGIGLPIHVAGSGTLDRLVDTARDYAKASTAENTNKAYAADWKHFGRWCRRHGADPLGGSDPVGTGPCPDPQLIGLYLTDLAAPVGKVPAITVTTIERRLSGLAWHYQQRGFILDRKNRHIATVLAGIKRKHARPPVQKEAILAKDIRAMIATLPFDLRGLRDRAILLVGYAGGLRLMSIRTIRQVLVAGSRCWTTAHCSSLTQKQAGARLRLVADLAIKPAQCKRWNNGCTLPRSVLGLCSDARLEMVGKPLMRGFPTSMSRGSSSKLYLTLAFGATCQKRNVLRCSLAIPCGPALPLALTSTSATSRIISVTPPLR